MLSNVLSDLRFAVASARRQPGFTFVAVVTLALGIGANTAMFSIIHATLLKPLPFEDPDRLVLARRTVEGSPRMWNSAPDYYDYKADATSFETLAALRSGPIRLTIAGRERPERIDIGIVSHDLFTTLGAHPIAGRSFSAKDAAAGAPLVTVVSRAFAERQHGSPEAALGKAVVLAGRSPDDSPAVIIGVMPAGYRFLYDADAWIQMRRGDDDGPATRQFHSWVLVGRLKNGVELDAARQQVDLIGRRLQQAYPATNKNKSLRLDPLQGTLFEAQTPRLMLLMGAVGLVLLIACANVAGLLLARGASRQSELAVRAALGASRGRIVAQLLTESLLLALAAGVLGVVLAIWLQRLLPAATGLAGSGVTVPGLAVPVLAFAFAVSLATGILFGTLPAFRASSVRITQSLTPGLRWAGTAGGTRLRGLLVVGQVAVSLVLLVGAGLLIRSVSRLMATDLGFDAVGLLTTRVEAPYEADARRLEFFNGLAGDLAAVPGVTAVAFTSHVPIRDPYGDPPVWAEAHPPADSSEERTANLRLVTPGYFKALGMTFIAGREFDDSDRPDTRPVTVITRETARTLFPDGHAIGQRIMVATGGDPLPVEVIGIVGDARLNSVASPPTMAMYVSIAQRTPSMLNVLVRTSLPPASIAGTIRALAEARDPNVPIDTVTTMEAVLGDSVLQPRVTAVTLGLFAAMALLLAVLGLYGVLAYYVAQRRHEIGVRLALGADTPRVLRLVLWRSGLMVVPGLLVGFAAALGGARVIQAQLYDITPFDPWTYGAVGLLLAVVALAASAWPAWRAAHIDPVRALRAQ